MLLSSHGIRGGWYCSGILAENNFEEIIRDACSNDYETYVAGIRASAHERNHT